MNVLERSVELINPPKYETLLSNVEQAARNCYRSQDKITDNSAEPMIRALIKSGHFSVIEFADLEFMITCDRALMAQLTRHRLVNFAIESQRYCSYIKDNFYNSVSFIVPYDMNNELYETWRASCLAAEAAYFVLLEKGAKPETARSVLPNCVATHIVCKMNMRELRHILEMRLDSHAQSDIRDIAYKMLELVYEKYPVFVEDIVNKYINEYIRRKNNIKFNDIFKFVSKTNVLDNNILDICKYKTFIFDEKSEVLCRENIINPLHIGIILANVLHDNIAIAKCGIRT